MTDEHALLGAIAANPHDDTPRLAYADWLQENDQPERAEFIRLQCRAQNLAADEPEAAVNAARQAELLSLHGDAWKAPLAAMVEHAAFERGFVEAVAVTPKGFAQNASAIFRAAPVRMVMFPQSEGATLKWATAVAKLPELTRLTTLDLSQSPLPGKVLARLLQSPHLAGVQNLRFHEDNCAAFTATTLAECGHLAAIRSLEFFGFHDGDIGDAGCSILAAFAPHLRTLEQLDLRDNRVGDGGIEELADSKYLTNLKFLYLGDGHYSPNEVGPGGLSALAGSANFANLEYLHLDFNEFGDEGVMALAASPHVRRLKRLTVVSTGTTVAGVEALAGSEVMRTMEELDIGGIACGDRGVVALARSPHVLRLRVLSLMGHGVTVAGITELAGAPWAAGLRDLRLTNNTIGDDVAAVLCESPAFRGLKRLRANQIAPKAERRLRKTFGTRLEGELLVLPSMYARM